MVWSIYEVALLAHNAPYDDMNSILNKEVS